MTTPQTDPLLAFRLAASVSLARIRGEIHSTEHDDWRTADEAKDRHAALKGLSDELTYFFERWPWEDGQAPMAAQRILWALQSAGVIHLTGDQP